MFLML